MELTNSFPNFYEQIRNKIVCDFGCGKGEDLMRMAYSASFVKGIDSNAKFMQANGKNYEYATRTSVSDLGFYDVILSKNSFEHFPEPDHILRIMRAMINDKGKIYITFGPTWFAPYGAHMRFFTPIPWVHLLLPEALIMLWRKKYRNDGAKKYTEVESGLNKMSLWKFECIIRERGLRIVWKKYWGVWGLDFLTQVPFVRQFFTNHVSVILEKD